MHPDALYAAILSGLQGSAALDGLEQQVRELGEVEPRSVRQALVASEVAFRQQRVDDGLRVLSQASEPSGAVDLQRAKGLALRGDFTAALETARGAVQREPNLTQGAPFLRALAFRLGGEPLAERVLHELAAHPDSFRAQVLLGQQRLAQGDLAGAQALWAEAFTRSDASAEVAQAIVALGGPDPRQPRPPAGVQLVPLDAPLWLYGLKVAPPPREPGQTIAVWAFTDDGGERQGEVQLALSLPLLFAERLALFTTAYVTAVLPIDAQRGFSRARAPWKMEPEAKALGPTLPRLWLSGHLGSDVTGERELTLRAIDGGAPVFERRFKLRGDWLGKAAQAVIDVAVQRGATAQQPAARLSLDAPDERWLQLLIRLCETVLVARGALDPAAAGDDGWLQPLETLIAAQPNADAPKLMALAAFGAARQVVFPLPPRWYALLRRLAASPEPVGSLAKRWL